MVSGRTLPALDGIRGLAVLMVIAHNVQLFETPLSSLRNQLAMFLFNIGWTGVQLFFVLSGFLITGILLDTQDNPRRWRNFAMRRLLRIFPLYYGTLLLIFVLLPWLGLQPDIYQREAPYQLWHWLYLSNWAEAFSHRSVTSLPHFWSLAVEEQFYLLWPLVLMWRRTPRQVLIASLVLALLSLVCRIALLHAGVNSHAIYVLTPCRMDALTLGAAAAAALRDPTCSAWMRQHHQRWMSLVLAASGCVCLLTHGFPRNSPLGQTLGYTTLAVLFTALVLSCALKDLDQPGEIKGFWRQPALRSVGKYSYGMYVIHKPVHDLFSRPLLAWLGIHTSGSITWASAHLVGIWLVSYGAAVLSYKLFEVHFLRLKRHFA